MQLEKGGETKKCLNKYQLNDEIIGTYSNNGWTNVGILDLIYETTNGRKSCLLLDQFPSHCDDFIKEYSIIKSIELIYVPKGLTHKYQPLDVMINGILKNHLKNLVFYRYEFARTYGISYLHFVSIK
jgi:hypothetical protein